jgi:hypothetical protein
VRTEKILPLPRVRFEFGQDRLTELHPLNPFEQYLTRLEKLDLRWVVQPYHPRGLRPSKNEDARSSVS